MNIDPVVKHQSLEKVFQKGKKPIMLPMELMRHVDYFTDPSTHTRLRATCRSLKRYLDEKKSIHAVEYLAIIDSLRQKKMYLLPSWSFSDAFEIDMSSWSKNSLSQHQYRRLCECQLEDEVLKVVILAFYEPFTCSHIDLGDCRNYAIGIASRQGHVDLVRLLLGNSRVNPADDDNRAIVRASSAGRFGVVQHLLQDPRVDPSARGNFGFKMVAELGYLNVVRILLPRVDASANNNEVLRFCARERHGADDCNLLLTDARVRRLYEVDPFPLPVKDEIWSRCLRNLERA